MLWSLNLHGVRARLDLDAEPAPHLREDHMDLVSISEAQVLPDAASSNPASPSVEGTFGRGRLEPHLADRLLDLLGTDDAFRELFQASPPAALRSIGYGTLRIDALSKSLIEPFALCEVGKLASKGAIRNAREALRQDLIQGLAYTSPQLDACNLMRRADDGQESK